ncbi:MAG: sulfate ABC transporter permease subunit, partial [Anaerolineae bacterium]|nr:sulfate ABC transporter permease subunit [Anaerolineae bacterium]
IQLTVWTAAVMAILNTIMGTLTAYMLVKYRFPGKSLFNAFIDLPFAIPTLVTGVMLVLLYGPQTSAGMFIQEKTGEQVLYAPPGIILALLFVGYPFVIRAVQPVLLEMDVHQEEAAHTLGAYSWGTFWQVIFPAIRPAILTGALLSFARALGEFGAIIIVAGNLPMKSQTATVYIYAQVEGGNMAGASSVSLLLIFIALAVTLSVDLFKWRAHRV